MKKTFNLTLKEEKVELVHGSGPVEYTIKELTGKGRDSYTALITSQVKVIDGNVEGSVAGLELELLARCLFGPDGQKVPRKVFETWPSSAVAGLVEICQEVSGLKEDAKEKEGNG